MKYSSNVMSFTTRHDSLADSDSKPSSEPKVASNKKEEMERQLREWNALDIELYNKVNETFEQQVKIIQ